MAQRRSTLPSGLGGTCCDVALQLKVRLLDLCGEPVLRIVKLACLDTELARCVLRDAGGQAVQLDHGTELTFVSRVPTAPAMRSLDLLPTIKARHPNSTLGRASLPAPPVPGC